MKRFTFLAVACLLALTTMASWDGTTTSQWVTGSGTPNDPYLIENENQLAYLAQQVNSGTNYSEKYFKQTADLDLGGVQNADGTWSSTSKQWNPIGSSNSFNGTFDGDGHNIRNLYINAPTTSNVGLFGFISGATIKKLNIESGYVIGYDNTGAICGKQDQGCSISYCSNEANVSGYGLSTGGICGLTEKNGTGTPSITYCTNYGTISGETIGGICGKSRKGTVSCCLNLGQLYGCSSIYNGNICGIFLGSIDHCYYDKQICTYLGAYEQEVASQFQGLNTTDITGNGLSGILTSGYTFEDGMYPRLTLFKDNDAVILGASPVFINTNETVDSVSSSITFSDKAIWSTTSKYISISGQNGTLVSQGGVCIKATRNGFIKKYTLLIRSNQLQQNGTIDNPLTINSLNDLVEFQNAVNNNGSYKGFANHHGFKNCYFKLTCDIDLKGSLDEGTQQVTNEWQPIGSFANSFHGHFNGENHEISNLYINKPNNDNIGFFGTICFGSISHVNLKNGVIRGKLYVGGICGNSEESLIYDCSNSCNIENGFGYVGGIVGLDNSKSVIKECTNYGTNDKYQPSNKGGFGGICGYSRGSIISCTNYGTIGSGENKSSYIAGICGNTDIAARNYNYVTNITDSKNYGLIAGFGYTGGIVGRALVNVNNCTNYGEINGLPGSNNGIGGIVGSQVNSQYNHIEGCVNNGRIESETNNTGGIAGSAMNNSIDNCINNNEITSSKQYVGGICGNSTIAINSCLNNGTIRGNSYVGGIVGTSTAPITNSFNAEYVIASTYAGGICGKNSSRCDSCINIGAIEGTSNIGAIAGSNSGSVNYCFSDKQMFNNTTICNGTSATNSSALCTNEMTGDKLQEALGTGKWSYDANRYPLPSQLANSTMAIVSAMPVILWTNDDNTSFDIFNNITKNFNVGNVNNAKWECDNNTIAIVGGNAYIEPSTEKDTIANLTVKIMNCSKTVSLTLKKANGIIPSITWNENLEAITYGDTITAKMLNATVENDIEGEFIYNVNVGDTLDAGQHKLTATFIPADGNNYLTANASAFLTVNKASTTINWDDPEPITFGDTLSNVQLNATANVDGEFIYSHSIGSTINAGTQQLSVTFMPTDDNNYTIAKDTVTIVVNQATPIIIWATPSPITYGDTISTQLNAISAVDGVIEYNVAIGDTLNAGDNTLIATLTPNSANYKPVSSEVVLVVNQAKPKINWAKPQDIVYGTYLDNTQLNATANAEGTFTYSVAADSLLEGGTNWIYANFVSEDNNYLSTKDSVSINVKPATPVIVWDNPSDIEYGTKLDSRILNAKVDGDIDGELIYVPSIGQVLEIGEKQMLIVTFIPNNLNNYSIAKDTVYINVSPTTTIVWEPKSIVYGTKIGTIYDAETIVEGTFSYSIDKDSILNAGEFEITVNFTPASSEFKPSQKTVKVTVEKADPVITWEPQDITYGTKAEATYYAKADIQGSFSYSMSRDSLLDAGEHEITATFTPSKSNYYNYNTAKKSATITVNKAETEISWDAQNLTYGSKVELIQTATANNSGEFTYSVSKDTILNVGKYSITAVFTPSTENYNPAKMTIDFNVLKGVPVISWTTPDTIAFGTKLDIFNATANVDGEFTYSVEPDSILNVGDNEITAEFSPASSNFESVSSTVTINVTKAPSVAPVITCDSTLTLTYGTGINTKDIKATANVDGEFSYSIANDSILPAGRFELVVSFTSTDLQSVSQSVTVIVNKAKLLASVSSTTIKAGESIPDFAINYKGFVNGDDESAIDTLPSVTCNADNKVAGTYDIVVSGGYASNYEFIYENATLTVEKDNSVVDNEAFINIYPNPTTDAFYVNASDDITEVRIFNAVGKLIMIQPIEGTTRIDISEFPEGAYIVKAGSEVARIIKK